MGFELHITCSKDISKLNIDFTDGTSSIIETPEKQVKPEKSGKLEQKKHNTQEDFLDTDNYNTPIESEVIIPPKIDLGNRPVKVASELQNLNL